MEKFIHKKAEKTVVSIRMDNDLLLQIDKIATESEISRNEMIIQCINYALKYLGKNKS